MLFKLSNLNSNLALTLGYLNPALNNSAQISWKFASANQKSYADLGNDTSSVWFLRLHFAGKPVKCREMSAVYSG